MTVAGLPFLLGVKKGQILQYLLIFFQIRMIYRTPRRTLSQLEKYNFSGEEKNHRPGRCNHIKRTITLLPSCGNFRKKMYGAIPLGRYGLRHTSFGHNSK
jgi:hypothetical protein